MKRLSYIDWMRGLACLLMFQTHCYDSWLRPDLRETQFYKWSQLGGTLPAPLFTFLAGISFALVTEKLREKGMARNLIARQTILRGAEIFGMGILFRIQEFILGYKWAPWTDLLRVDILNILGLSMMLMGVLCWFTSAADVSGARWRSTIGAFITATAIAMLTPPLWTTWRPKFLPWPIESYINGVHTFSEPQHWLFPIFPWSAFAFAGLAIGFLMFGEFARHKEAAFFGWIGAGGVAAILLSKGLDASPVRLYTVYDYWHSNPNFLLLRCGVLLIILSLVYAWCRWGFAQQGFSPVIQLGKTSLLVYWVHIEFVYGRFSILPKRGCSILQATLGLLTIFLAMLALSVLRTRFKKGSVRASQAPAPAASAPAT
ncbi:MAG TPA: heparan-alpha-glucosaminide N-acetyltransferase domain-containing protein [Candidatus Sulfotelmatobacter sp.]|nr:heparan-alpha-glucosaminide N-acetyltransferase domain-containing protein [Candidatus Sulfotelmatobacter sp.]